jgi:hypothetical protein
MTIAKEQEDHFHDYLSEIYSLQLLNIDPQPLSERMHDAYCSNQLSYSHYDYLLRAFELHSAGLPV